MKKTLTVLAILSFLLMLASGIGFAGIEPVPWQPEINKLHSIELNMGAIQKRLDNLALSSSLPNGTENYLLATINQLGVLDTRLADVLYVLPAVSAAPFDGQEEVLLALDGILMDVVGVDGTSGIAGILEDLYSRLGIEPSPWRVVIGSITARISVYMGTLPNPCDGDACTGK